MAAAVLRSAWQLPAVAAIARSIDLKNLMRIATLPFPFIQGLDFVGAVQYFNDEIFQTL